MNVSRRQFVLGTTAAMGFSRPLSAVSDGRVPLPRPGAGSRVALASGRSDPWIEVEAAAIRHNVREIYRTYQRPILAVVKNNAYGLGLTTVAPILDPLQEIVGLAVVKTDQALALRDAGVSKPVLLMGSFGAEDAVELATRGIELAPYQEGIDRTLAALAARLGRSIRVHAYIDTGLGRMGMSFRRAPDWIARLAAAEGVEIRSTFAAFTEEDDFDPEQLSRFLRVAADTRRRGIDPGRLHMASSHSLFFRRESYLDWVRPGLVLYGAYPAGAQETGQVALRPAFRLRARVVRVERLEPGDGVSYGRNYIAARPTWTATLPVGHADGYPRSAVEGCEVLIGDRLYPVIGAVSASHTIVELGDHKTVEVGDIATLIGPERREIHPNAVATRCGISVYDVLMHLSATLPSQVV